MGHLFKCPITQFIGLKDFNMATKIFNSTETSYTGTADADLIVGNDLGNFIDGAAGNDVIVGGSGNDFLFGGSGNNVISGGAGDDFITADSGNNIISGGSGNDSIVMGDGHDVISGGDGADIIYGQGGHDVISGGDGDDLIYGGEGDDILSGGAGSDVIEGGGSTAGNENVVGNYYFVSSEDFLFGGAGNDTFAIGEEFEVRTYIEGGASGLDNSGNAARYIDVSELEGEEEEEEGGEEEEELVVFDTVTGEYVEIEDQEMSEEIETDVRLNLATRPGSSEINTAATTIAGYNAVDTLEFNKSGDFDESLLFKGIERIELASGVNISLSSEQFEDNGESLSLGFLNPGTHVYGVAGGPTESVTVELEFEEAEFEPDEDIVGAEEVEYDAAEFSVEEYSVASLFHNVDMIYDASEGEAGSFTHVYGGNESAGATETVYGSEGVDYGVMNGGNDTYYGADGNDIFEIGGFGTGVSGTTSAADDGQQEWIATGAEHDLIVGGDGVDTLRITTGIGADTKANGTIVLNDANFQSMEVVQVGGTVDQLNVENEALQMLNDHYYFQANGNVDDNTFIGTTQDDVFVSNSGNDVLTGGAGADTFVFGKVHEQVVTGDDDEVQTYVDTAFELSGIDFITDFMSGLDKIALNTDMFSSLTVGGFSAGNLVVGSGATAGDVDDYILFDTSTFALSYDADGSGAGAAIQFATLDGVTSFSATDVEVFA
jgi:Ca2+-binding RTX toxin-like protein